MSKSLQEVLTGEADNTKLFRSYVRTLISASSFTDAFVARAAIQKDQYLMQPWLSDDIYICDTDITSL